MADRVLQQRKASRQLVRFVAFVQVAVWSALVGYGSESALGAVLWSLGGALLIVGMNAGFIRMMGWRSDG